MSQRYGNKTTYLIHPDEIDRKRYITDCKTKRFQKRGKIRAKAHGEYLEAWLSEMENGGIYNKAFSKRTIGDYKAYVLRFFNEYRLVTPENIRLFLSGFPREHVEAKKKAYKALVCFSKLLIEEEEVDKDLLEAVKKYKPKSCKDPKRITITEKQLDQILDACDSLQDRFMVLLLARTGVRASEACQIRAQDLYSKKGSVPYILVREGKGGKTRKVPFPKDLIRLFLEYYRTLPKCQRKSFLFWDQDGKPMTRFGMYSRIRRIGEKAGSKANPHALRRAFVSILHGKSKPLGYLQRACGHSNIKTTEKYLVITENEYLDCLNDL